MVNKSLSKYLKVSVLLLITILILWLFGKGLNWREVGSSIRKAHVFFIVAALIVVSIAHLLRAKRWQVLLEPITKTSLAELFATTTVGFAAIFFVGRAGEIVRPMWLPMRDKRVRPSAAFVTLGIERIFDLAALICFFAFNLLWFETPPGRASDFEYIRTVGYLMLIGVAAAFLGLYLFHRIADRVIDIAEWALDRRYVPERLKRIFLSLLRQLAFSLNVLRDWREIALVTFWTVLLWIAIVFPTWLLLIGFDLDLGVTGAVFVMGWAAVGSLVPTPGGAAGAFHVAAAGGLIFLNVSTDEAAAVSIVMHLVYFAPAVIFGLYYFLRGDINVAGIRHLLSSVTSVEELEEDEKKISIST